MRDSAGMRVEALADLFEERIPEGEPLDDGGPSARRTVAVGIAATAVQLSNQDAAETFTAFRHRFAQMMNPTQGRSKVQELLDDVATARRTLDKIDARPHANTHSVDANVLRMPPTIGGRTTWTTVVMSHVDGAAMVEDLDERPRPDRMRLHAETLARVLAAHGVETPGADAIVAAVEMHGAGRISIAVPHEFQAAMPAMHVDVREINHGSAALFERRAAEHARRMLETMRNIETLEARGDALMDAADHVISARGLPMRCEMTIRGTGRDAKCLEFRIGVKALDHRLMLADYTLHVTREVPGAMCRDHKSQCRNMLARVEHILKEHERRRMKMKADPTDDAQRVDMGDWRFDAVLTAYAARQSDPEGFLRAIVTDGRYAQDESAFGRLVGDQAVRATVRVQEGEATIRILLGDGILWSHGTVTVDHSVLKLPDQMLIAMKGRRLGEILLHPMLDPSDVIANAVGHSKANGGGTTVVQTRRVMRRWGGDLPMAA